MNRRHFISLLTSTMLYSQISFAQKNAPSSKADLALMDSIDTAHAISSGQVSASEVLEAAIERIELLNPRINAVVTPDFEGARQQIAQSPHGKLWGTPTLIKDLNAWKGLRYTRGSKMFLYDVAQQETAYTQSIRDAGMISLGKSNTPEFGLLPTTESLALGACHNPWNTDHSTGGSSGGAGAAVAARMVPMAQASDGGGSIRIPGAQCGVLGLKPSHGRFPDQGTPARIWPISVRHMISMSVRDSALSLALTENKNGPLPPVGYIAASGSAKYRIALSISSGNGHMPSPEIAAQCEKAAKILEKNGHHVEIVENTPYDTEGMMDAFVTNWAVSAANIVKMLEDKAGVSAEMTGLLEPFTIGLARHFNSNETEARAHITRTFTRIKTAVNQFFNKYDVWLTPVTATTAPKLGFLAPTTDYDTLVERTLAYIPYTPIHNVAGTPGISIPTGNSKLNGLPMAVQLSAGWGHEAKLLNLAYQLEKANPWNHKLPDLVKEKLNL